MRGLGSFVGLVGALSIALASGSAHASTCVAPTQDWSDFPTGYQCIVGVQQFTMNKWGVPFPHTGGAPAKNGCLALGACLEWVDDLPDPAVWNRYAWGTKDPQAYDVLIFPPTASNGYGHAAVFDHASGSDFFVMDDNWDGNMNRSCSWNGHDGWVHNGTGAPYGFYRLKKLEPPPPNQPPKGNLDTAACDAITGWTQDPDDAGKALAAHLYFDAMAGAGVPAIPTTANVHRTDVGDHGFSIATPLGLKDGKAHQVFAYGIDAMGGPNSLLAGSPKSFTCAAPKAPFSPAIRRHVIDPTSLAAWKLAMLTDVARLDDAAVTAIPTGADAPSAPSLIQADDGSPDVWVVDGTTKRHVVDPASMTAWEFDAKTVVKTPAAQVKAMPLGADWPTVRFAFASPAGTVFLLDHAPPLPPPAMGSAGAPSSMGGASSSGTGGKSSVAGAPGAGVGGTAATGPTGTSTGIGGAGGAPSALGAADTAGEGESGGCAVNDRGAAGSGAWALVLALAALARRRRR
jgi:hypothetical protein